MADLDNEMTAVDLTGSPWPFYDEEQIEAVVEILKSGKVNYWTGEVGRAFESEYAESVGCKYGVALANGSVALELALITLGIGAGDDVVVTPRTFLASASAAMVRGVRPVFADVDRDSGNITAKSIERVLTPKTKALILVHLYGWPCDMDPIVKLAKERRLKVIEDCAQSHGATYKGRVCGSFGDVSAWSFCQDKIITTGGEGGMLTTSDRSVWERAWSYKDHGKNYDAVYNRVHKPGFRWVHEDFGTNWRMMEIQAALGRIQIRRLAEWVALRRRNTLVLVDRFSIIPALRAPFPPDDFGHACYKLCAYVEPEMLKADWSRDRIMLDLNAMGIPCTVGICSEVYMETAFQKAGLAPANRLPVAKELGETCLQFLVHPTLSVRQMHEVADRVECVMARAVKC